MKMMEFHLRPNYFIFMEYLGDGGGGGGGLPPLDPSQYATSSTNGKEFFVKDAPSP